MLKTGTALPPAATAGRASDDESGNGARAMAVRIYSTMLLFLGTLISPRPAPRTFLAQREGRR
jgi:hypothetical protein